MDFPAGPGVDLSGVFNPDSRCGALARALGKTVKLAHGVTVPLSERERALVAAHLRQLLFAGERFSAAVTAGMQVSPGRGNGEFPDPGDKASSVVKPEGLSTKRAAELAGCSPRTMRNLIYRDAVKAWRVRGGALRVDIPSLAEWISENRKEDESKVA
jgi:Helix-turn-helix domain